MLQGSVTIKSSMGMQKKVTLLDNSRFYILTAGVLASFILVGLLRVNFESDQLYYIRLQQVMGAVSLVFWYIALLISPLTFIFGKKALRHVVYARRAIGVLAAYYALLHLCIALWGQLGGIAQLGRLPDLIQTSLVLGGVATLVLIIMAGTSFDVVVKRMTFTRWKLLHRLTYAAFVLVVLHIWTIGTHVTYSTVQYAALVALLLLAGLESYRILMSIDKKWHFIEGRGGALLLVIVCMAMWFAFITSIPRLFDNYHSKHHGGAVHAE